MPLVPKPFESHTISRHFRLIGSRRGPCLTEIYCRFCPTFDIQQHLQTLSQEKQIQICDEAAKLHRQSVLNQYYQSSEFYWEVCAFSRVFACIQDDEALRIDKRRYEFITKNNEGERTLKYKIPDATMGLRSHEQDLLKRGYICTNSDCNNDHEEQQPDERLSDSRLKRMMNNPDCGLIVDGEWGKTGILFPFAVYEAKSQGTSTAAATRQICHACRTYLAMLDDLARDPENVSRYQGQGSDKYQLFAFTSRGSEWQVFIAWNYKNDCMIEAIWEGDVKVPDDSMALMCLINQVHDYATHQHRDFVMQHLEAWYDKYERMTTFGGPSSDNKDESKELNSPCREDGSTSASDTATCDIDDPDEIVSRFCDRIPKWKQIKEHSKHIKREKARRTRVRNQQLRGAAPRASLVKNKRSKGPEEQRDVDRPRRCWP